MNSLHVSGLAFFCLEILANETPPTDAPTKAKDIFQG